jgi:hypothetical protein
MATMRVAAGSGLTASAPPRCELATPPTSSRARPSALHTRAPAELPSSSAAPCSRPTTAKRFPGVERHPLRSHLARVAGEIDDEPRDAAPRPPDRHRLLPAERASFRRLLHPARGIDSPITFSSMISSSPTSPPDATSQTWTLPLGEVVAALTPWRSTASASWRYASPRISCTRLPSRLHALSRARPRGSPPGRRSTRRHAPRGRPRRHRDW